MVAQIEPLSESAGGGVWLAVITALALLLTPATAVAQSDTTPPSILESWVVNTADYDWVALRFTENVRQLVLRSYSVTYDGVSQDIRAVGRAGENDTLAFQMTSRVPDGAVVVVSYVQPETVNARLQSNDRNRYVESFTWDVTVNRQIPPEQAVYYALGRYFEGSGSLSSTQTFVDTYFEDLLAKVAAGGLSDDFNIGDPNEQRSAWGTEGTEDWGQVGSGAFPRRVCYFPPGADTSNEDEKRCVDTQAEWGWGTQYQCGGRPQPGLHENDYTNFFWACTGDGQWVPVKRPRPGVDYSHDSDLERPPAEPGTDPDYNEKCRYVRRHPDGHAQAGEPVLDENGNVIPEPAHRYNGDGTWTTIHGANYDPIDGSCRGRG